MRLTGAHAAWLDGDHPVLLHSSPGEQWARTALWITAALGRGEKVLYKTSSTDPHAATAVKVAAQLDRVARGGRMDVVDLQGVPGFDRVPPAEALIAWHNAALDRALDEGFTGVAFAGEQYPWPAAQSQPERLLLGDRVLDRLARSPGIRVLCHVDTRRPRRGLPLLLRLHHRHVDDSTWGADVLGDRVAVTGEIDFGNADHFGDVIGAAIAEGVTTVDLVAVELLSAAGMAVLSDLATGLARQQRVLTLTNPAPLILRTMTAVGLLAHPGLFVHRDLRPAAVLHSATAGLHSATAGLHSATAGLRPAVGDLRPAPGGPAGHPSLTITRP